MKKNQGKLVIGALGLLFTQAIWAVGTAEESAQIRASLTQQFPQLKIDEITNSPVNDVFQVTAGPNIIYVTKDGRYAFSGDLIDLKNGQANLTEEIRKNARVKGMNTIKKEDMIVFSPKDPKYTITVFTDVDCGYCRKLQSDMKQINELGIAVRYLAFPRSGPNSETFDKMVSIWCAKDKNQALNLAKQDKPIEATKCDKNPVMSHFQLGMQIGVSGTPTLVFEDGTMIPGYLPPDKLLEVAKQLKK